MTLNGVMAVTLRYFIAFGKPALQKTICGGIYARVYCIFSACTMSLQRKFAFPISSPDECLVIICINYITFDEIETIIIFHLLVIVITNTNLPKADHPRLVVCGAIWGVPMKIANRS